MNIKTPLEILSEVMRIDLNEYNIYAVERSEAIKAIESYHSQLEDKWISVEKDMPKKYQMVIINFKGKMSRIKGKVTEGWWNGEYWDCFAILHGLNEKITITQWMPLPSNPKQPTQCQTTNKQPQ